jgi:hypothetical protein
VSQAVLGLKNIKKKLISPSPTVILPKYIV